MHKTSVQINFYHQLQYIVNANTHLVLYMIVLYVTYYIFIQGEVDSISNCLDYKQGGNIVGKRGLKWLIANNINFQEGKMTNQ